MRQVALIALIAVTILLSGCTWWSQPAETSDRTDGADFTNITGQSEPTVPPAARGEVMLTLDQLTQAAPVPGSDGDLLLLERSGGVHVLPAGQDDPVQILDLSDRVDAAGDRERGLKGATFHPAFEENGVFFLVYDDTYEEGSMAGYGQVTRFQGDPDDLSQGVEELDVVIEIEFPNNWFHNMAGITFGPDGMLYVAVGDGGSWRYHAQNLTNLWGSVLRLDVDTEEGYRVPEDNPFVDDPAREDEIWLYGFRNPWRIGFHPGSGDLFVAHTGEDDVESVYIYPREGEAPRNHGWPYYEGNMTFETHHGPPPDEINFPVANFLTRETPYCALVGGTFYQGDAFPELQGKFVFADHCTATLMFTELVGDEWALTEWFSLDTAIPTSVDVDHNGELLVVGLFGHLHQIVPE